MSCVPGEHEHIPTKYCPDCGELLRSDPIRIDHLHQLREVSNTHTAPRDDLGAVLHVTWYLCRTSSDARTSSGRVPFGVRKAATGCRRRPGSWEVHI